MKKQNGNYRIEGDFSNLLKTVNLKFMSKELICYTGNISRGEYEVLFKIKSQSFDKDILCHWANPAYRKIIQTLRKELFIENQFRQETNVRDFIKNVYDSVFYLSTLFFNIEAGNSEAHYFDILVSFCTDIENQGRLRKHIVFFSNPDESNNKILDEEDIMIYVLEKKSDLISSLDANNKQAIGKLLLQNLNIKQLYKYFLKPTKHDSWFPKIVFFLITPFGHAVILSLFVLSGCYVLDFLNSFWFASLLYSGTYLIIYLLAGKLLGDSKLGFARKILFSKLNVFILVGWVAMLPLSNDLWVNDRSIEFVPFITFIGIILLLIIIFRFYTYKLRKIKPSSTYKTIKDKLIYQLILGLPMSILAGIIFLHFSFPSIMHDRNFYSNSSPRGIKLATEISELPFLQKDSYVDNTSQILDSITTCKTGLDILERRNGSFYCLDKKSLKDLYMCCQQNDSLGMVRCVNILKENNFKTSETHFAELISEYSKVQIENSNWFRKFFPTVMVYNFPKMFEYKFGPIFIFPGLLFLGALLSFLVGYFIQYIVN